MLPRGCSPPRWHEKCVLTALIATTNDARNSINMQRARVRYEVQLEGRTRNHAPPRHHIPCARRRPSRFCLRTGLLRRFPRRMRLRQPGRHPARQSATLANLFPDKGVVRSNRGVVGLCIPLACELRFKRILIACWSATHVTILLFEQKNVRIDNCA